MIIEKHSDYLSACSNIYFDERFAFCKGTFVILTASKYGTGSKYADDSNTILIDICDHDDYSCGWKYKTEPDKFLDVLHELLNWMRDHENGTSLYIKMLRDEEFIPSLGCQRVQW